MQRLSSRGYVDLHGWDISRECVERAVAARVPGKLKHADAIAELKSGAPARFDVIVAKDLLEHLPRTEVLPFLEGVHAALKPGGVFLMQDILGHTHLADNIGSPLAPFMYTISCMHCMSVSLAAGGPGLGAMWGRERALEMLAAAGFRDARVETLPHDPINYYYIASKQQ